MSLLRSLANGGYLRAVDAALAESLRRARPDTPELVLAAAALASRAVANGHSRLPLAQVPELLLEIAGEREPPRLPAAPEWIEALRASPWTARDAGGVLVLEEDAISLRRYWSYETRLAEALRARLTAADDAEAREALDPARIAQLFDGAAGLADDSQAAAAGAALRHRFALLTGGPGTGKTSTVARILALFAEQFALRHQGARPRIVLAAPTGKAAARLAEAVRGNLAALVASGLIHDDLSAALPGEARTVHRLLGWQPGSTAFRHGRAHPLRADLVVVDEASMIDLPLMCKLVEAVPDSATLLLIGDRDQLPSVETGDVLAAVCDAAGRGGALRAHRVNLTRTHRQAEDVDVPRLAALVRDGEAADALAGLGAGAFRGVRWLSGGDRALAEAVLAQALPAYRAVQAASDPQQALALAQRFRVLTAVRDGGAGSVVLNARIAAALDPALRSDAPFHGRLVLVTQNSYRHQLYNGDIGVTWAGASGELRVWFDGEHGLRDWLPGALPAHEPAFAMTVHKSQGSEFGEVFLALPEQGARVISRELIYTGLTRCRAAITLWAPADVLGDGIRRRAQRWSGLAARL